MSAMATCSSSLAFSRGLHSLSSLHASRLFLKPQAISFRNHLGLQWRRTASPVVACSEDSSKGAIIDVEVTNSERGAAPVVQPRRKRGRPRKAPTSEPGASSSPAKESATEDEEEWDFFGELARHIESGHGAPLEEEDLPNVETASPRKTNGSIPEVEDASSFEGRQGSEEEMLSKEDVDDVDLDDPKYQQKPDWMQDAVWEAINNQLTDDGDDAAEGQPLWVEEDDPTWPAEEPEDGWGFRTSQFFDKVSIKSDKPDDDDDDELRVHWENEADDWMIQEITAMEWESCVLGNPSPLVVYVLARYGRRGLDSWKTLEQLEKAVTKVWESNKAPLRAVKVDIGMEIDLGSALGIDKDDCPQLLFIKNGKGLYRLKEQRSSEELVQLMAHFFYNGAKPACLKTTSSPESFKQVG